MIAHGYEQWGTSLPGRLDGMFAFAVWDAPRQRLLLARDRTGEKPLFYREDAQALVFASSLMGMREFLAGEVEIDFEALECFLSHAFIPAPHTCWRGVRALPPAHFALYERGRPLRVQRYWDFPIRQPAKRSTSEAEKRTEEALGPHRTRGVALPRRVAARDRLRRG